MSSTTPENTPGNTPDHHGPSDTGVGTREYRDAFRIADELNVHGRDCVCPTCAARLPGLLAELARAIENGRD